MNNRTNYRSGALILDRNSPQFSNAIHMENRSKRVAGVVDYREDTVAGVKPEAVRSHQTAVSGLQIEQGSSPDVGDSPDSKQRLASAG